MTDPVKEQLSACLDGELAEAELDLLLKRLDRDPSLRQSLGGYALVGEVLRTRRPMVASAGFAARVAAAVAAEAVVPGAATVGSVVEMPVAARVRSTPSVDRSEVSLPRAGRSWLAVAGERWLKPAAGLAIAAGVAAIAVVSLQPVSQPGQQLAANDAVPAASPLATASQAPSYTVPTNTGSSTPAFIPAARLTNYVVAHSEYSSPLARRTVLSGVLSDDQEEVDAAAESEQAVTVTTSGNGESHR